MEIVDTHPKESFQDIINLVSFSVAGVPDGLLDQVINDTIRDFCKRTRILRRVIPIVVQACVRNYLISTPDCYDILHVRSVRALNECGRATMCGMGIEAVMGNELILQQAPARGTRAEVEAVVMPPIGECLIDSTLLKYSDAIAAGTIARLTKMPGRPWSSRELYNIHTAEYMQGAADANVDRLLGNRTTPLRSKNYFNRGCR